MSGAGPVDLDALCQRYLAAQLAGNRKEAVRLMLQEGLERGAPVAALQTQVVRRAQDEIGRLWQLNRISIAQEHMASAISMLVLSQLFEAAARSTPQGKKIVVACVEGELHDLPSRLVADFLDLEGFDVRYLGANVPHDALIDTLRNERPDLAALSVTMSFNVPALTTAVERIHREVGTNLPILVGGHAVRWAPGIVSTLGVHTCGADPGDLAKAIRELLGQVKP